MTSGQGSSSQNKIQRPAIKKRKKKIDIANNIEVQNFYMMKYNFKASHSWEKFQGIQMTKDGRQNAFKLLPIRQRRRKEENTVQMKQETQWPINR